jgi:hypothetical protein
MLACYAAQARYYTLNVSTPMAAFLVYPAQKRGHYRCPHSTLLWACLEPITENFLQALDFLMLNPLTVW